MNIALLSAIIALLGILLTFIGLIIGVYTSNKWNKREETYRTFRHALDMLRDKDLDSKILGNNILEELIKSKLLQKEDKDIILNIYNKTTKKVIKGGKK